MTATANFAASFIDFVKYRTQMFHLLVCRYRITTVKTRRCHFSFTTFIFAEVLFHISA